MTKSTNLGNRTKFKVQFHDDPRVTIQSNYGWFGDFLAVSSVDDCANQCFDATNLAHNSLVALVIAGEVGKNAGRACDNVDIARAQQLDESLQQSF